MHERAAEFAERAQDRHGIDLDVLEFDAGTETAAAAADAVGCDTAAIASTIVVSVSGWEAGVDEAADADEDRLVAAITSGANRLDLDAVAERFGATSASMADPERIREVVGWSIGGVPPICHDAALPTVLDPTLTEYDTVHGAAGTPSALFQIDPETLADLADATVVDLTE
ncbi:YbaK/EbsC family protein [Halorubrum halophilum]|uniref:YbaK/EbsC family protein n=1 Tax=Halorubrum halophilum TaxID=413816 RepID=UPI000679000E|nr:YbaK/EbsC family protein [Halorubrum halophilum]